VALALVVISKPFDLAILGVKKPSIGPTIREQQREMEDSEGFKSGRIEPCPVRKILI